MNQRITSRYPAVLLSGLLWFTIHWSSPADAATRTWIGGNVDWIDNGAAANWTPADEPDPDDEANFNTANSVNLGSNNSILALTLSGGIDLLTNGNDLAVDGLVQLSGSGTNLFVGGGASELNADNVTINSGGVLELTGGSLVIDEESGTGLLQMNAGGTFAGNGTLTFADTPILATTLLRNDGTLTALSRGLTIFTPPPVGTLTINDSSIGGRVDLDGGGTAGVVNVNRNQTLDINVPLSDNFAGTMNLFHNATLNMSTAWTMDGGTILADNGFVDNSLPNPDIPADISTIAGAAFTQTGGTINVVDTDGTLRFDAPFSMSGGTITNNGHLIFNNDATIAVPATITMPTTSSSLTVGAGGHVTISQNNFDLDGGNALTNAITVNANGFLQIGTTDYDPDTAINRFDGTVNLNSGGLLISTTDAEFVMDGTLNMNRTTANIPSWSGEPLDIGNDAGTLDANLNVTGLGISQIGSQVDFNSDANVNIAAGAVLQFVTSSTVNFDTVNGVNHAQFTGAGTMQFGGVVNVNEAVTLNMLGGTVDLDGADDVGEFINIDAPLVINAATMAGFGRGNSGGGVNTLDIDARSAGQTGKLSVNLDNPLDEWALNAQGVMNLSAPNGGATLLDGSDVIINGTVNVVGDVRTTARLDVGGTIHIGLLDRFRLAGGNNLFNNPAFDPNRIAGGTIDGPGTLGADATAALLGFGTINAIVDFDASGSLLADDGLLTVNGTITDVHNIGTFDTDGTLNVTSAWNSGVAQFVTLQGGVLRGGTVTVDNSAGIAGHGTVTSRVLNNTMLRANINGLTLVFETAANDNDWDGATNTGTLEAANGGILELRDNASFDFAGTVTATNAGRVFTNGFGLDFDASSQMNLTGSTFETTARANFGGTLNIGAGDESIIKGNFLFQPTSVTTLNADLRMDHNSNSVFITEGATFNGTGAIVISPRTALIANANADVNALLVNEGRFRVAGDSVGRVDLRDYQQIDTGTPISGELFLQIAGTNLNEFDRLVIAGTAALDGNLHLNIDGAYTASLGDVFPIISATAGVLGTFTTVTQPAENTNDSLYFHPIYGATTVTLRVVASGDFNADGSFDCEDVDSLVAQIVSGIDLPTFDLNGDSQVDASDLNLWLARAGAANLPSGNPYLRGDANLDGVVDGSDFIVWNSHKFTSVAAWCSGDFTADGVVDGSDFIAWNGNKFTSSGQIVSALNHATSAVPEPGGWMPLAVSLLGLTWLRKK